MIDTKRTKSQVYSDWAASFPQLYPLTRNKFYRIVGPIVSGIELVGLPRTPGYAPHFVVYPLWKSSPDECLDAPIIYSALFRSSGLPFSIEFERHQDTFDSMITAARTQIRIPFDRDLPLAVLRDAVNSAFTNIDVQRHPIKQAGLYELMLYASIHVDDVSAAAMVLVEIREARSGWDMKVFSDWLGDFDVWYNGLEEVLADSEMFKSRISANTHSLQLRGLSCSRLINS